jgi:hypothetical protein
MSDGPVALAAQLSRESLAPTDTDSLIYALIRLHPGAAPQPAVGMPLNAALLIERTAAMGQEGRLEAVQQAFRTPIDQLGPADRLAIVLVGDRPKVLLGVESPFDKEKAKRILAFLDGHPGGERPALAEALAAAEAELRKAGPGPRANRLVLVSASPSHQEPEAERLIRQSAESGVGVSAFGLGPYWSGGFLTRVVDAGRGHLYHLPRPGDLGAAVRREFSHLQRLPLTGLKLYLRLAKGVRLRRIFQVAPSIAHWLPEQPTERDAVVRLGDMADDEPRWVLAELVLPPMTPGTYRVASADLAYETVHPAHRAARTGATDMVVRVGAEGEPNAMVLRQVEAVSTFSLIERAIEARRGGEAAKALQLLKNAARIAANDRRVSGPLGSAIESLESTGSLPEAISKALFMAARGER